MLVVNARISIPRSELHLSFARSSGPGGQNVNKVNSKVTLHWPVKTSPSLPADVRQRFLTKYANRITTGGELVMSSQETRDQAVNIEDCLEKLREMLLSVATAPRKRHATKPTKGSQRRRIEAKKERSAVKKNRGKISRDE
ncbi:MAG TPA: alternative ribosome rescue aminoacyl-tRNA hydrolase ArfB [Pirellulaceae bacterium]|nr:alternative ribosome rescue aminoacyl-tRNA hydrolase ArfB [Pirellulaceae bacterium]